MKKSTKITIAVLLVFLLGLTFLPAEVIRTGEHSFYSTEAQMEYTVCNEVTKACQLTVLELALEDAKDENAEIYWVKGVPNEVVEGMNKIGNCVVSKSSYKDVEVWNWLKSNGETWTIFIIYRR